jgi:hypothetical protein
MPWMKMGAAVLALFAAGCAPSSVPMPAVAAVSLTGGAGLTADDDIFGMDAASGADGAVHVAWVERVEARGGGDGSQRLVYRRGSGTPLRWSPRIVLAQGGGFNPPTIVAADDGVHVFAGGWLHHWWRPQGGASFRDLGDILGANDVGAEAVDAIAAGGGITIAYTPAYARGDGNVYGVRWTAKDGARRLVIASVAAGRASTSAPPILHAYGHRLMLLWANTSFFDVFAAKPGVVPVYRQEMDIHVAWSGDDGLTWTRPDRLARLDSAWVSGVAATGSEASPIVFFAASGLFETRLTGGAWSPPTQISKFTPGFLSGSADTMGVAAGQCGGHPVAAWIDARFRRSDRRWWNPLGGIPWSDDPDWDNNDVLVANGAPRPDSAAEVVAPSRVTALGSLTRQLAVVERDGQLLVIRSGRARVHKAPNDMGAPPEVTLASVPCD